jgi:hypothetical protein
MILTKEMAKFLDMKLFGPFDVLDLREVTSVKHGELMLKVGVTSPIPLNYLFPA